MKTGEIYRVDLDPTIGEEIQKTRPVVILNSGSGKKLRLAIVVPVTRWQERWEGNPFFVTIDPKPHHGLSKKSVTDCFQIRALSHDRFVERLGEMTEEEMSKIRTAVALILDIEVEHCL